jgi:hypothetical protein
VTGKTEILILKVIQFELKSCKVYDWDVYYEQISMLQKVNYIFESYFASAVLEYFSVF